MNRKGYTLVEVLAVVAILGILSGVATMAVSHYLSKTREKAFENNRENICVGVKDAILESPTQSDFQAVGIVSTIAQSLVNSFSKVRNGENYTFTHSAVYLVKTGYINELTSPINKSENCNGSMYKLQSEKSVENNGINSYRCYVKLYCGSKWIDNDFVEVNINE